METRSGMYQIRKFEEMHEWARCDASDQNIAQWASESWVLYIQIRNKRIGRTGLHATLCGVLVVEVTVGKVDPFNHRAEIHGECGREHNLAVIWHFAGTARGAMVQRYESVFHWKTERRIAGVSLVVDTRKDDQKHGAKEQKLQMWEC